VTAVPNVSTCINAGKPSASDHSNRWHLIPEVRDFWAVAFADPHHGWLVGTDGRILKLVF
jgi:hypothetical protein